MTDMNTLLRQLGLGLLLLCWCLISVAADPDQLYQIEIVVFSHITEAGLRSEYWPLLPPAAISATAINLTDDQILPQSQWALKPTDQLLKRNNYVILLHLAWQEPAADARQGQIIHLTGGETYAGNLPEVNGSLAIRLEHYFNLHVNLRFILPWQNIQEMNLTNIAHDNNPYVTFKINERLRLRSNELNYIDHPLYGMLIKIIPLTTTPTTND